MFRCTDDVEVGLQDPFDAVGFCAPRRVELLRDAGWWHRSVSAYKISDWIGHRSAVAGKSHVKHVGRDYHFATGNHFEERESTRLMDGGPVC